jgi:hypothetical protein
VAALTLCLAVAIGVAGCVGIEPSASVTTLQPGYEQWFRLDWAVEQAASGTSRNMRLLVQALDPTGNVVAQRLEWAHPVPALSRAYFETPSLPPADHDRVAVWTFEFLQRPGGDPFFRF